MTFVLLTSGSPLSFAKPDGGAVVPFLEILALSPGFYKQQHFEKRLKPSIEKEIIFEVFYSSLNGR